MVSLPAVPPAIAHLTPVSGKTLLFPVVGHPAAQVRAPSVFNALFAQAGIDAVCFGLDLPPERVIATCTGLLESPNVGGLLVTVPYKKTLAQLPARLGSAASRTGAVNALRRAGDGRVEGDLFDGLGFVQGLLAAGHSVAGRRVLLLGAGGAGFAIAAALADAGVGLLAVYDPVLASVDALVGRLQPHSPGTVFRRQSLPQPEDFDIVINASPVGLQPLDPLPLDPQRIAPGTLVCDIIMKPETTPLLKAAIARGLPVHRGRAMLDHQIPAYLTFFGFAELAQRVRVSADAIELSPAA
jgi:shikimate dehydrogenase